jgi:predicted aspartyl protease
VGHFRIPIQVARRGGSLFSSLDALVDTGSTYTWIPRPTLVVFAPDGSEPILGAYTLEGFLLAADPVNERLISVPGLAKRAS